MYRQSSTYPPFVGSRYLLIQVPLSLWKTGEAILHINQTYELDDTPEIWNYRAHILLGELLDQVKRFACSAAGSSLQQVDVASLQNFFDGAVAEALVVAALRFLPRPRTGRSYARDIRQATIQNGEVYSLAIPLARIRVPDVQDALVTYGVPRSRYREHAGRAKDGGRGWDGGRENDCKS